MIVTSGAKTPTSVGLKLLRIILGFSPYAGGLLIVFTRQVLWLAVVGVIICSFAAVGRYAVAKSRGSATAKSMLIVDLKLFPVYYVFAAVIVRYMFLRHG